MFLFEFTLKHFNRAQLHLIFVQMEIEKKNIAAANSTMLQHSAVYWLGTMQLCSAALKVLTSTHTAEYGRIFYAINPTHVRTRDGEIKNVLFCSCKVNTLLPYYYLKIKSNFSLNNFWQEKEVTINGTHCVRHDHQRCH